MKRLWILLIACGVWANDLVIKPSASGVDATTAKIEQIIAKKGLHHFTTIDHSAGATKAGLKMPKEKVIIFGNPKMGTKIMLRDPKTAIDLPIRVLVYEDRHGQTQVAYHDPIKWSQEYNLSDCKMIEKMHQALEKITDKAIK